MRPWQLIGTFALSAAALVSAAPVGAQNVSAAVKQDTSPPLSSIRGGAP